MNERSRKMLLLARGSGNKEKSEPITCNRSCSKNNCAAKVSSISVLKTENSSNARDCCMPILKLGTDMSFKDKSIPVFESENVTSANDNFISVLESENSTGANENPMPNSNSPLPVDKPENNNNIIGIHKSVSESESFDNNQKADNISNDFVVKECVGCKMSLRRVVRKSRHEDNDSPTHDFSSGSEDEYKPSTDSDSCDSHVLESEPVERLTGEVLENQDNVCLSAVNKRGKKRAAVPQNWKKEKAKRQRNSGLSYKSATGKIVEARKIGPPCSDKCRLSCSNKVAQDDRVQLFQDFWKLGELQRQRDYLTSCVDQVVPQYRRISAKKPRAPNCAFYVNLIGKKVRVCKTFLINTFGITERAIRTVITSKMSGSGIAAKDERGKHSHHKKVDEALVQSVRDHIDSIPRIDSHYLRQHTSRQFIDGGLTIAEMHRHYQKKRSEQNEATVSYDLYSRIFNKEFNIGFFIPKKDQCDLCEGYKNANAAGKASLEKPYQQHLTEKDLSRVEKANDKEKATKKEIGLAVYDLQAVMPVPMGQSSAFFYKSKLNCYNFTVSEIGGESFCYFWHEALGGRGATEIGSCVLFYLQQFSLNNPGMDIVLYSDNCGGQQKNKFFIALYLYAVNRLDIKSITHKYLVRGHTQNEGDAIHSIIEKAVKRAKKSGPIYVPEQYVTLIRNAKKKGDPLRVKELSFGDFVDIKKLYDELGLNLIKNAEGRPFKINEVRVLHFEKGSDCFTYKTSFEQVNSSTINFKPQRRHSANNINWTKIILKPAYTKQLNVLEHKLKDLRSLLSNHTIPEFYRKFYDSL